MTCEFLLYLATASGKIVYSLMSVCLSVHRSVHLISDQLLKYFFMNFIFIPYILVLEMSDMGLLMSEIC